MIGLSLLNCALTTRYSRKLQCSALVAFSLLFAAEPIYGQSHDPAYLACAGVDRSLTKERAAELSPLIAKQLKTLTPPVEGTSILASAANLKVKVLKSFRFHAWSIILVSTNVSDDAYLFYRQRPEDRKFVALYGGAAGYDPDDPNGTAKAEQEVTSWLRQEMADIPVLLADCFAWHFVVERRQ